MRTLSKSKLLAFRQCPKRLWLEIHQPELRADSASTQASFSAGHQVGDIARSLYNPKGKGILVDLQAEGFDAAFARTAALLDSTQPIFEAGLRAAGALAFADVLMPAKKAGQRVWRMIEVKSSTSVKDYHRDDVAIQAYVAKAAGVPLASIALAHIDSHWVYLGKNDYQGMLVESDLTLEAFARSDEVKSWIAAAQSTAAKRKEPQIKTGEHCAEPYACGFIDYCQSKEPWVEHSIVWLPGKLSKGLQAQIDTTGITELGDAPNDMLNSRQLRVKAATVSGHAFFDSAGAGQALAPYKLPGYFIDVETIQFAVPIWESTRPYQQIPFQFSLHRLSRTHKTDHMQFLDLSGNDPSQAFAKALVKACSERGPIFVYNAGFEKGRITELAVRFPHLADGLLAINERVVDLLPIAREHYYHPSQQGSWSIKKVLPAVCPDLSYDQLGGIHDGAMVMNAYLEALSPDTPATRKTDIRQQLQTYCALDTYAMVRLWAVFSGQTLAH